jgi:hypothetical protein
MNEAIITVASMTIILGLVALAIDYYQNKHKHNTH